MLNEEEMLGEIEKVLIEENIKYDNDMLKKVVSYCALTYKDYKKQNSYLTSHVIGVAKEVAGLRIDDVSVYAALLHEVVNLDGYDEKKA